MNKVKEVFDQALAPFPGVKWACCPLDFSQWKGSGKYNYALLVYAPYDEIMTIWKYQEPRQMAQKKRRSAAMKEVIAALEKATLEAGIPFLIPPVTRDNMSPPYKMSLSSKEVGVRAGVGWIDRNDLLITYEYGPRIETVSAVFQADHMETRPPVTRNQCGDCTLCVTACPFHLITGLLAGCGSEAKKTAENSSGSAKVLKYRRMPTATSDLFEAGIKPLLEKKGYKLEAVGIKDSVQREMALEEGQIDFHVDANPNWLDAINASKGTHLVGVVEIPTVPTGLYAGSKTSLADVAEGDTVIIPNDASNLARSYQLLERLGWIKLNPSIDKNKATKADIAENPKHLNFREMKGPTIANIRSDAAYIILRGSDAYNAKIDFNSALFPEKADTMNPRMRMCLSVQEKNKDQQWVKDIIEAYKSPEFKKFMETQSKIWILPDYMK